MPLNSKRRCWEAPPSTRRARRCRRRRWRWRSARMRFCWAPSAVRSGRPMPRCVPSRACCSCARRSACSPICARWCRIRRVLHASPIKAEILQRRGHHGGARADGRHLFRRQVPHRDRGRRCVPLLGGGDRTRRAPRGRIGACAPRPSDVDRQGQCARDLAPVAFGGRAHHARRISRRQIRTYAGRCRRHAPLEAAARLRRDRHRKHVRRYPHRRSLDAGGLAWGCCRPHL